MYWQIVLSCRRWGFLLTVAAAVMALTVVMVVLGFLGPAARTDWELGGGPDLSRQNIHPLDEVPNRALL